MSAIKWDDSNNTGFTAIDEQHQEWVNIYNRLVDSFNYPPQQQIELRDQILKELLEFTYLHFKDEEQILYEANYPDRDWHRRLHKEFHQHVYQLHRKVLNEEIVFTSDILSSIRKWFLAHTSHEDQKALKYVREQEKLARN